jgi:4-hydroxybenzoate polyprenyltransferase
VWPVIYDTMYAMVDRDDDKKIGVKSTAILFNQHDKKIIAMLQSLFVAMLICIGLFFDLKPIYFYALGLVTLLFVYQQWLIKDREKQLCFRAFLNNNWVGLIIFLGILLSY